MFVLRRTPCLAARVHAARLGARTATRLVQPARTVRIAPGSRRSLCTPAGRDHVARDAAAAGAAASDDGSDVDEFEDVDAFDEAQWADAALGAEAGDGDGSAAADAETRASAHSEQATAGGPEPVAEGEGGVAAPSAAQPGAAGGVSRVKPALGADDGVPTEPFVVTISGASGMIGSALTAALSVPSLANRHHPVIAPLVRRTPATPNEIKWLPNDDYIDVSKLEGCEALVNLAGRPLGEWFTRHVASATARARRPRRLTTPVCYVCTCVCPTTTGVWYSSAAAHAHGFDHRPSHDAAVKARGVPQPTTGHRAAGGRHFVAG